LLSVFAVNFPDRQVLAVLMPERAEFWLKFSGVFS
jgi:hypothetical protein